MRYFDNASTSYVYPVCIKIMNEILENSWGNPNNLYNFGLKSREIVENARKEIADTLEVLPEEIVFVSSASEGNAFALSQRERALISPYEHHDIKDNPCTTVIDDGFDYKCYVDSQYGENVLMRSHMWVNNETGEIFDIDSIFSEAKKYGLLTHCDATQALGNLIVKPHEHPDVDIMTFGGHKVHAPKGQSFMYIKKDIQDKLKPMIYGSQEGNLRGSTENVHQIAALGYAVKMACSKEHVEEKVFKTRAMRDVVIRELQNNKVDFVENRGKMNVPSILNLSFKGINGDALMLALDENGFCVSTGSACNSGDLRPSYVLEKMGVPKEYIYGTIRVSFDPIINDYNMAKALGISIVANVEDLKM